MDLDETIAAVAAEASRLLGAPFEGTPAQNDRLAASLGLSPADAGRLRLVADPEADEKLDPDEPGDEAAIAFLGDDEAVARFLTMLLERFRTVAREPASAPAPKPAPPARPGHSAAFVRVRDRLLALGDRDDRAALARLFGAIGAPERDPSPDSIALVREIATLDDADVLKLARWCRTYVTKAGDVPKAAR